MTQNSSNSFFKSLRIPFLFLLVIWSVKVVETIFRLNFHELGVKPRTIDGLKGVIFYPLIHGDWSHLINNSISLFMLSWALFYFYDRIAGRIIFWIYFLSSIWLWCIGRPYYHIGASGVIYGLASFLFFSGIFRKNKSLTIISLLVVFLYGSMVWGVLPIDYAISFEGHAMGALSGFFLARYYRNEGPDDDKEIELEDEDYPEEFWKIESPGEEKRETD